MTTPRSLRQTLKNARQEFAIKQENRFYSEFVERAGELLKLIRSARCLAGYLPMKDEPNVAPFMAHAAAQGIATALPFVDGRSTRMRFLNWSPGDPLERAAFGFEQPLPTSLVIDPDLILVPLVGFSRALDRIGNGMGHYDRALATHPDALRIGIGWSVQEIPDFPPQPWDMPLDAVLTEREWITGERSRIPHG